MSDQTSGPTVCPEHLRFAPCRICIYGETDYGLSDARNDVAATFLYQQGGEAAERWLRAQMERDS